MTEPIGRKTGELMVSGMFFPAELTNILLLDDAEVRVKVICLLSYFASKMFPWKWMPLILI